MRLDHVAHPCEDPDATHRFYATVLGLQLVQAYAGSELMLVYALPGGGSLVFGTDKETASRHADADWEREHVGLIISTHAEFEGWVRRLQECGIPHRIVDHERVYFADPDGLVLELEVASQTPVDPAASEKLARWLAESA